MPLLPPLVATPTATLPPATAGPPSPNPTTTLIQCAQWPTACDQIHVSLLLCMMGAHIYIYIYTSISIQIYIIYIHIFFALHESNWMHAWGPQFVLLPNGPAEDRLSKSTTVAQIGCQMSAEMSLLWKSSRH